MSEELHWLSAAEAVARLRDGSLDLADYVEALLERTERLAYLNTYISHDPAQVRQSLSRDPRPSGPLFGLPFALKDAIDTADLPTTAATPALRNWRPGRNAPVAQRLLDAGGTLMGKQALGELSFGITGNNPAFGTVGNPYHPRFMVGGSSGGTAAGIAAGLVPVGLGADTGGSARIPAALCGCVGFRPSHGRYDQQGVVPISSTRDTIGPLARTVTDIRLIDAICTATSVDDTAVDLSGLRIGVPRNYFYDDIDDEVGTATERTLAELSTAGAMLVEQDLPDIGTLNQRVSFTIVLYEALRELAAYLYQHGAPFTVRDVVTQMAGPAERATLASILDRDVVSAADYREALVVHRPALQKAYATYFADHDVAAVLIPTTPAPARLHQEPGRDGTVDLNGRTVDTFFTYIRNCYPASNAGLPALSIPSHLTSTGMPAGVELVGPASSDARLLAIGEAAERLLPGLPKPTL
ncbi:amidase family protein [Streptomyces coffeae]|uniref:Indole acetimide hydrolase n=1 Tax=Streptomyces coffeae TaxID=621382 RepID=A0ABS1NC59_9ACTN|nr:amidase family protein [Streptomyces coffeae]MBL1097670.1 indole acetimide hydrolase [Streptomyces coffeae]